MFQDSFSKWLSLIENSLDGVYGSLWEIGTICAFVILFNIVIKKILVFLEGYFKRRHQLWKESFVKAFYPPLSYYVWFFTLIESFELIFLQVSDKRHIPYKSMTLTIGLTLAFTIFLLLWKNYVIDIIRTQGKEHKKRYDSTYIDVINKILTIVILIVAGFMLLEATGSNFNTIMAFGGVSGLALAFASQEVIASFFGGLMIYMTRPFSIGDWILLPERQIEGHVEEIGWYNSKIRTLDKRPIYVPNAIFSKIVVVNPSRVSHRQIKETIGIRYRDVDKLKAIISDVKIMLENTPTIDQAMPLGACFSAFGTYSLDILFYGYSTEVSSDKYNGVKEVLLFGIIDILNKHQAELAFPTTSLEISQGGFEANPMASLTMQN